MATLNLIYGLCDPQTGFLRYVGKSTSGLRRPNQHAQPHALEKRTHVAAWVRSLVRIGLKPDVLVLEETSREDLFDAEQFHIGYFKSIGCDLTNQTVGGVGPLGWKMPEDVKAKISAAKSGKCQTAEHRAKNAAAQLGNTRRRGAKHTAEARLKMSISHLGVAKSPEHRAKIAASNRRTWLERRASRWP